MPLRAFVLFLNSNNSVSIQDPFSDGSDPAFQKRNVLSSGGSYQSAMNPMDSMMRMQYENKDHFAGMRKGQWFIKAYLWATRAISLHHA